MIQYLYLCVQGSAAPFCAKGRVARPRGEYKNNNKRLMRARAHAPYGSNPEIEYNTPRGGQRSRRPYKTRSTVACHTWLRHSPPAIV